MTTTYTKSLSIDFGSNLDTTQLYDEIESNTEISPTCITVSNVNGDIVNITFDSPLSSSEQTTLDTIISNHVPSNTSNYSTTYTGYISFNSNLADARAIRILATNIAGGIDIDAGIGGITMDTTNAISFDAEAASNFTTTVGNLTLNAITGLVNIDGGSGINIGGQSDSQPINIGTGMGTRTITVGNIIGSTMVDIVTGTGGFIVDTASGGGISLDATGSSCNFTLTSTGDAQDLTIALLGTYNSSIVIDSSGTASDAIRFNSAGGIDIDASGQYNVNTSSTAIDAFRFSCSGTGGFDMDLGSSGLDLDTTGPINLATSKGIGGSITLDATTNNGGITLSSGSQGIAINSGTGLIGIGHWSAGNIVIGTSAIARNIEIGNDTGATSLTTRWGTGGFRKCQPAPESLSDVAVTLTMMQIKKGILTGIPTVDRNLTLPTASLAVSDLPGIAVNDAIDFTIINKSTSTNSAHWDILVNTGGTMDGNSLVSPKANNAGTYETSGSGTFRMRFTNVTASNEAYTIYRIG